MTADLAESELRGQRAPAGILPAGAAAPDFELEHAPGEVLRLRDLRGKPVVLAFYPADWSPVCGDQVTLYNECLDMFEELGGARVLGVSVDSAWCHAAYAASRKLRFPLLADFEPKGAVARRYGVYDPGAGTSGRALFVIDAEGVIRWSHRSAPDVNPGADGILAALESLADGDDNGDGEGEDNAGAGDRAMPARPGRGRA
jgi:peroxiredoxin